MSKPFFKDKSSDWEKVADGLERKVIGYNNSLMLVKVKIQKGTSVPMHHHEHVQSSYVESGKFELYLGDERLYLEKGDGFFAASNVPHSVTAIEDGIIIDAFNPAREDFLK